MASIPGIWFFISSGITAMALFSADAAAEPADAIVAKSALPAMPMNSPYQV